VQGRSRPPDWCLESSTWEGFAAKKYCEIRLTLVAHHGIGPEQSHARDTRSRLADLGNSFGNVSTSASVTR
jgi:hypothetical protein